MSLRRCVISFSARPLSSFSQQHHLLIITIITVIINCLFEFNILGSVLAAFTKDGGGWPKDGKHWQLRWKLPRVGRNYLNRESLSTRQWMKQGHWKIQETSTETFRQKARLKLFIKLIIWFFCCCYSFTCLICFFCVSCIRDTRDTIYWTQCPIKTMLIFSFI